MLDLKAFAKELKQKAPKGTKLGWVHQAVAAGFGFRTWAGLVGHHQSIFPVQSGMFNQAYYDARLTELREANGQNAND